MDDRIEEDVVRVDAEDCSGGASIPRRDSSSRPACDGLRGHAARVRVRDAMADDAAHLPTGACNDAHKFRTMRACLAPTGTAPPSGPHS